MLCYDSVLDFETVSEIMKQGAAILIRHLLTCARVILIDLSTLLFWTEKEILMNVIECILLTFVYSPSLNMSQDW